MKLFELLEIISKRKCLIEFLVKCNVINNNVTCNLCGNNCNNNNFIYVDKF